MIKRFEFAGHEAPLYSLEPFEEGKFFCAGGDRVITSFTINPEVAVTAIANTSATVYSMKYLAENKILLAGTMTGHIHVIDLKLKKEVRLIAAHDAGIFDIAFSSKRNLIITVSGDGSFSMWKADDLSLIKNVKLCNEKVRCVTIHDELNVAAIGCGDGTVRLIDLNSSDQSKVIQAHNLSVNAIAFDPDNDFILTGGRDAHLKVWDTNWNEIESIPAHNYAIYSICFSSNGKIFFSASRDKSIKVWNSKTFSFMQKLDKPASNGHIHSVNKIISIDNWLISCSDDKKVMGWSDV